MLTNWSWWGPGKLYIMPMAHEDLQTFGLKQLLNRSAADDPGRLSCHGRRCTSDQCKCMMEMVDWCIFMAFWHRLNTCKCAWGHFPGILANAQTMAMPRITMRVLVILMKSQRWQLYSIGNPVMQVQNNCQMVDYQRDCWVTLQSSLPMLVITLSTHDSPDDPLLTVHHRSGCQMNDPWELIFDECTVKVLQKYL